MPLSRHGKCELHVRMEKMNTRILALCYPELSEENSNFIDNFRMEHDTKYVSVVRPHFTMFFPIADLDIESFTKHIESSITGFEPFNFTCRYASLNKDDSCDDWYVFLIPDEGNSNIHLLHDRIYTGEYKKYHRLDLGYIPHIGIGTDTDVMKMKKQCEELNQQGISISGRITEVVIAEYDGSTVNDLKTIKF